MLTKLALTFLASALVLALSPVAAAAQESSPDTQGPEPTPASQPVADVRAASDSGSVVAALRLSSEYAALLAPPAVSLPTSEELRPEDEHPSPAPAAASEGSSTGLGFMIGGAAAFVGGLIIGGTGGNLIAAGGVALAVYGAIVYF